ncbi:unnamed protein product [Danaus chrysippus]|uniref:Fatty acyl-CoA reductase n=1 Tax=Danaus chrysippus TaxID=151541 RepID=A0A8J2QZS1_9NEOP|nr:unnamed protein product [Danaus chrysippus]
MIPARIELAAFCVYSRCDNHYTTEPLAGGGELMNKINKVLIERLLSNCNDLDKVYVMIREKKGVSTDTRLKEMFNVPLFDRLKQEKPHVMKKVVPIGGDLSQHELAIKPEDLEKLVEKVSVVFHSAATVRFNEKIEETMKINYTGTKKIIDLTKKMKNLDTFLYISTAFSNMHHMIVEEKLYSPMRTEQEVYDFMKNSDRSTSRYKKFLGDFQNPYTLSKCLCENLVSQEKGDAKTVIVRPSIVGPCLSSPIPGWLDTWIANTALFSDITRGMTRVFYGDQSVVCDMIPVDFVSNFIIIAAAKGASNKELNVYNVCSSSINPISWKAAADMYFDESLKYPKFPGQLKPTKPLILRSPLLVDTLTFTLQTVPAAMTDLYLKIRGEKPRHLHEQKRAVLLRDILKQFTAASLFIKSEKARKLISGLSEEDKVRFPCDANTIDWREYMKILYGGVQKYIQNSDCSSLSGSLCISGQCACEPGQQVVLGGSMCIDVAPYYSSSCVEDFQCGGLFTGFECRKNGNNTAGQCMCKPGFHFLSGRCWMSKAHGEACSTSEECMNTAIDPFSLQCNKTCQCADGYTERQRGICRKTSSAVGEACVLNSDCNFPGGVCNPRTFVCSNANDTSTQSPFRNFEIQTHQNISRVRCNGNNSCVSPFVCSGIGICVCPPGYYESRNGGCLAELGSPSTPEQCVGFLAEVVNGICTCRNNFFFDENMRDCVKVSRFITDSCMSDASCYTFGPARCGPPSSPYGIRTCECVDSIWDDNMNACRYFSGVGEYCELDSDCLAGDKQIDCVKNSDGAGVCTCPIGQTEFEGLCLESDLDLGDSCQNSLECGGNYTICNSGICSCTEGYRQQESNGKTICLPAIGGACEVNNDCIIENTFCDNNSKTCQCRGGYTAFEDICWEASSGYNSSCTVTAECALQSASCTNGFCTCLPNHHYKDNDCYPIVELFSLCTRSSECFLGNNISDRAICRNGVCQCDFEYPYSEELRICASSSTSLVATAFVTIATVLSILVQ